jgi:hypothetical protein
MTKEWGLVHTQFQGTAQSPVWLLIYSPHSRVFSLLTLFTKSTVRFYIDFYPNSPYQPLTIVNSNYLSLVCITP